MWSSLIGPDLSRYWALICPDLSRYWALIGVLSSHQFLHVAGRLLGRVDPSSLLTLRHPPPQLVVFLQDGRLGVRAQLSEDRLAGAGGGGSLAVNIRLLTALSLVGICRNNVL